jgi:PPP family 3-phenylpropionic acid transporter
MRISLTARFALFSSASNVIIGVQLAFWPLWLAARGLDPTEMGIVAGIGLWARVAAHPLIGVLADLSGDRRRVMLILAVFSLFSSSLYIPAHGFWPLLAIGIVAGTTFATVLPLADNAVLQAGVDYGRVRIWGSLTFLVVTLAIGGLLQRAPIDSLLALLLVGSLLMALSIRAMPGGDAPLARQPDPGGWRALMRARHMLFLAAAALIQASHVVYYGYSSLHWKSLGYDTGVIGGLWAEGVVAEIVLFYWAGRLFRHVNPAHLMLLGACAGVVRWTVLATATSLWALAAVNFMHCFTFAAAHLGAMYYLLRNAPASHAGTAQSLYSAAQGIGFGLVSLFAGALYGAIGGRAFLAMAAMAATGALAALLLARKATNS